MNLDENKLGFHFSVHSALRSLVDGEIKSFNNIIKVNHIYIYIYILLIFYENK